MARKILLADDSVTAQNMGRKILADAGYEVVTVNNGSAALKKIAELKPELVILDVYMPGYSGLEVCQRLKDAPETARIPVLLSVGKLEPFKPEEAQRVRAEGYIVKPFEASELLSALSKLEDKVVPRPEPSKPGRFARAFAAIEESSGLRNSNSSGDNALQEDGWKSRIGFPHEKSAQVEEKVADDSSIYNQVNRDLRTVVKTAAEHTADHASEELGGPKGQQHSDVPQSETDTHVDVAALVPPGLPKDVTPEEVAAIAAASVQIQLAAASAIKDDAAQAEASEPAEMAVSQASADFVISPPTQIDQEGNFAVSLAPVHSPETDSEGQKENPSGHESVSTPEVITSADANAEEAQDEPVTIASGTPFADSSSEATQWKAVPTALGADEDSVTLEQEMQKAYAAFVREENNPTVAQPSLETPAAQEATTFEAAAIEVNKETESTVAIATAEAEIADEPKIQPEPAAQAEAALQSQSESQPAGSTESISSPLPQAELETEIEVGASAAEPVICGTALDPVEPLPPLVETAPEAGVIVAETAASNHAFVADVHQPQPTDELETVRSTAAAWDNWRKIRDSGPNQDSQVEASTPTMSQEAENTLPHSAELSAMAVAAGAEQAAAPEAMALPSEATPDVASIVESVLADLRPKLMAEISRKMAEKK